MMEAIRQIVNVKNKALKINLPDDFEAKKVEVIILTVEDEKLQKKSISKLRGKLNLTDEQYIDFQKDVEKSREEWGKNI
ncbi:MAG TPA: hypothetical protein ENN90_08735 [Mariniphaga anaerophila]|uniref:Uncharacterized protein n=1 Tax=Mariniphaga anaerophila TaxID=1484053 RepID=A0A831LHK1_9BACT|nr:hypothetical protein [Mariniphaga anaerophila]